MVASPSSRGSAVRFSLPATTEQRRSLFAGPGGRDMIASRAIEKPDESGASPTNQELAGVLDDCDRSVEILRAHFGL